MLRKGIVPNDAVDHGEAAERLIAEGHSVKDRNSRVLSGLNGTDAVDGAHKARRIDSDGLQCGIECKTMPQQHADLHRQPRGISRPVGHE